jgi:hypothetical protein
VVLALRVAGERWGRAQTARQWRGAKSRSRSAEDRAAFAENLKPKLFDPAAIRSRHAHSGSKDAGAPKRRNAFRVRPGWPIGASWPQSRYLCQLRSSRAGTAIHERTSARRKAVRRAATSNLTAGPIRRHRTFATCLFGVSFSRSFRRRRGHRQYFFHIVIEGGSFVVLMPTGRRRVL